MSTRRNRAVTTVTMREFRASAAKVLRRAARTGELVKLGPFVLTVRAAEDEKPTARVLYGCMAASGTVVSDPAALLSADDTWSSDVDPHAR